MAGQRSSARNTYKEGFIPERKSGEHLTQEPLDWFYAEVKRGRNPFRVGEDLSMSRSSVRKHMRLASAKYSLSTSPRSAKSNESLSSLVVARKMSSDDDLEPPDPILKYANLNKFAKKAYRDFGYFRQRYFNRRHIPWQIKMAYIIMSWVEYGRETNEIVKGILNTPPGGGKTTTVTHDFPAWVVARSREVRCALGSRTGPQSERYVRRLRTTFERNLLLNLEFGRFKPLETELWRRDQFLVDGVVGHEASIEYRLALAGFDHTDRAVKKRLEDAGDPIHQVIESLEGAFLAGEKEPTVTALSQEMGFLGGRYDLNLWDDLCDRYNSRTPDQRDSLEEWWFAEGESRCEPGGVVALIGTRFGKYDLYRHCRDLTYVTDDALEERVLDEVHSGLSDEQIAEIRDDLERELVDRYGEKYGEIIVPGLPSEKVKPVYRYIKFPAHDQERCTAPQSLKNDDHLACVLDAQRFSYRHLLKVEASNPKKFKLTYQQEDEATEENLVQEIWLTGGRDKDGFIYPGCYNYERSLLQFPATLDDRRPNLFSVATVDPSAVNWWSIQWWIWDSDDDKDYLMDILRARLTSGAFLDWNSRERTHRGIMHDWQVRSMEMGLPIGVWIVEQNAAQRYLFQYKWVHEWMREMKVTAIGHETGVNKSDLELGIQTLGPRYRLGLVDLPYRQTDLKTRVKVNEFKKELVEWPDAVTDDMVSGHWFLQFNRYKLPRSLSLGKAASQTKHPFEDSMPPEMRRRRGLNEPEKERLSHVEARRARVLDQERRS